MVLWTVDGIVTAFWPTKYTTQDSRTSVTGEAQTTDDAFTIEKLAETDAFTMASFRVLIQNTCLKSGMTPIPNTYNTFVV